MLHHLGKLVERSAAEETQVRMGHGTLSMTADLYGHLFVADEQREKEILAAGERALMGG